MPFEIDFLPVGKGTKSGDAICLRYGNPFAGYSVHVVDGGYTETGQEIVSHLRTAFGNPARIDNVVLTHPDTDHVSGLFELFYNFQVGTLWMHRPWLHADQIIHRFHGNWSLSGLTTHLRDQFAILRELEELALARGTRVESPLQGREIGAFTVLAPSVYRYQNILVELPNTPAEVKSRKTSRYSALEKAFEETSRALTRFVPESWSWETLSDDPDPTSPSNESSIVQAAIIDGIKILLTGDVGPRGLFDSFAYASRFGFSSPHLIQVPHHGSRRNVTQTALDFWLGSTVGPGTERGVAICSAALNDGDHPRAIVENAFLRRGYPVFSTKGQVLSYSHGMADRGYQPVQPAPFRTTVEA
ncbi:ComEC/Rec2 family competence protein [Rhizobium leguminosarum]|uniref:ComEC/Rec2 family competence protein n=1 Tax=Rhizobium leguminosarum TaxID=384 RepID=UPI001C90E0AC|nr:MBL fold metallo-hydrolase [Rhizobium leguminosarum]MBY2914152.1 MBL fold metallo-hydrolase [Rhizobium leguminosarum]MBY2969691.1 MBL fold metallo-hydrolase [Rhizobium leguminosarum]MBY2977064.1 MBL fold metallo-hydrolase [Rhizobium leguminosarum]MBY3005614.1 MBL fold metallo-hydrolase [Rhizobium leguminosarum]